MYKDLIDEIVEMKYKKKHILCQGYFIEELAYEQAKTEVLAIIAKIAKSKNNIEEFS